MDDSLHVDSAAAIRAKFVWHYRAARQASSGIKDCTWGDRPIPKLDGGSDDDGLHPNVWLKIDQFCALHQLDPDLMIDSAFEPGAAVVRDNNNLPWPTCCYGPAAKARYERRARRLDDDMQFAVDEQQRKLAVDAAFLAAAAGVDDRTAVTRVLTNSAAPLSGLFRHAIAAKYAIDDVAARYRAAALLQYVFRRDAYDRIWGGLIPAQLRADAVRYAGGDR